MPELPEVEHLKRSLQPLLVGSYIERVRVARRDVIQFSDTQVSTGSTNKALLSGTRIAELDRRGKQLAVLSNAGRLLCIHLGMSGQLVYVPDGGMLKHTSHIHCSWRIRSGASTGWLHFRDPRRFGGIRTFASHEVLLKLRWATLGPDALTIAAKQLAGSLSRTARPIKAALLDQAVLAGVGNIYADESLYAARIHPCSISCALPAASVTALARAVRSTLRRAIRAGGSTLRDYTDGNGEQGWFTVQLRAYGRAGQPCSSCGKAMHQLQVAQRTTTICPHCQIHYG